MDTSMDTSERAYGGCEGPDAMYVSQSRREQRAILIISMAGKKGNRNKERNV